MSAPPGLLIAAPRSGSGKTTLTLGLMRALAQRGLRILGVKCGPDYIDPAFHAVATGRPGLNLDSWAMPPFLQQSLAQAAAAETDLILCEGLMGLFDGVPSESGRSGSSADIAAAFGWPVVLILDISGQSQSAAATVLGCATFDPRLTIAGVILNRVGSVRHQMLATEAIEALGLPVLGALRRAPEITLPERHLGLVQASETAGLNTILDRLADFVATQVDCDRLLTLAAPSRFAETKAVAHRPASNLRDSASPSRATRRFLFSTRIFSKAGARPARSSSSFRRSRMKRRRPHATSAGCPAAIPNSMRRALRPRRSFSMACAASRRSHPVHGECGGYMVLGQSLVDAQGNAHKMAGLLGITTSFAKRRLTLGYRQAELLRDCGLGKAGLVLRGHEFHYATIADKGDDEPLFVLNDAYGASPSLSGSIRGSVSGSFFHMIAGAP